MKLRGVWDEVQSINPLTSCTCQGRSSNITKEIIKAREKEHLYDFLMGINESMKLRELRFLSIDSLPTLNNAYCLLSQDEQLK